MSTTAPPADAIPESPLPPGGEQAWIEVIQKMDEVYNDLLQYEVALEEKNAALEESHQFIESVLASMSDILIVCDRNGGIEEVNASLQHFSGKTAGELEKTPVYDLFADDVERAKARDLFNRFGREGVHDCEFFLRAGDGSTVPVSMNCTPRLSQTGKLMGMVVTGRPVGELRRAYSALRQAHDDLKRTQSQLLHAEKMVSLGRLVAGVAHELNNPISFVYGNTVAMKRYAERLARYLAAIHGDMPREERETLRRELRIDRLLDDLPSLIDGTVEGAERTRDIVDALKRFSATDRDERQPFDLVEVKARVRNMLEVRLLYKKLENYSRELERTVQERTAELRESEARFRSLTELASDWYWEQDENGIFTKVSGPVLEMLGIRVEGLNGQNPGGQVDCWDETERETLRATIAAREPFLDFVFHRANADGSRQQFRVSGEPMFSLNSRFLGYRGIGVEVFDAA